MAKTRVTPSQISGLAASATTDTTNASNINSGTLSPSLGGIPPGAVFAFAATTVPTGYLECNGSAISRSTYAALFAIIGTTHGAGNGSTTFNIPDLRGQFVRGYDNGKGTDSGRVFGSSQGDAIRNITGTVGGAPAAVAASASGVFASTSGGNYYVNGGSYGTYINTFDASRQVPTATENRPVNIALMYCIKY